MAVDFKPFYNRNIDPCRFGNFERKNSSANKAKDIEAFIDIFLRTPTQDPALMNTFSPMLFNALPKGVTRIAIDDNHIITRDYSDNTEQITWDMDDIKVYVKKLSLSKL